MRLIKRIASSARMGKGFVDLGFTLSREPCERCHRRTVLKRESTAEHWCARCHYGALYPGMKQREELLGLFGPPEPS